MPALPIKKDVIDIVISFIFSDIDIYIYII